MKKGTMRSPRRRNNARRRGWRNKMLLLSLSLLLGFFAGEAAVRIFFQRETDTLHLRKQQERIEIGALIRPSADPELFYELKPDLALPWLGVTVYTDPAGSFRTGGDRKETKTEGSPLKIALLGDSTSFGWGIEHADTYAEVLREKLEKHFGHPVELRNYSVPGYNTHQELACFRSLVAQWSPDLLILHYDHNDPDPTNIAPPCYMEPEYGDNFMRSSLVKFILRRVRTMKNKRLQVFRGEDPENPDRSLDLCKYGGALYDRHLEELREMAMEAGSLDIPVLAIIFDAWIPYVPDSSRDPHYRLLHEGLAEHLKRSGFHTLDLYPRYQELMRSRGWKNLSPFWLSVPLGDCHPNRAGHAFIASEIFRFITGRKELERELVKAVEKSRETADGRSYNDSAERNRRRYTKRAGTPFNSTRLYA